MKTKKDRQQKKPLLVKKEPKTGESSLKKAVKNVKEILKDTKKKVNSVVKKETKPVLKRLVKKEEKLKKEKKQSQDFIKVDGDKGKKKIKKHLLKRESGGTESGRGIVYVGHIPHGFYEEQMKGYFSQFGKVTRVRVSRSKITGRSKGYGYVEFLHPEVAKIAAESMNNYLMCGRLVKAEYIPPEKQHEHYFKGSNWKIGGHPKLKRRMKAIRMINSSKPNAEHKTFVKQSVKKLTKLSQLLKNEGIDFKMKLGNVEI